MSGTSGENNFLMDKFINPISESSKVQWIPMSIEYAPEFNYEKLVEASGVPPKYITKNGGKP